MCDECRIAQLFLHQPGEEVRDPCGIHPRSGRFVRKSVTRDRRNNDVKTETVGAGLGQQRDKLNKPRERIRVAMDQQDRDGVRALSFFMDKMEAKAVYIGAEVMEAIQPVFLLFPVAAMSPVRTQVL